MSQIKRVPKALVSHGPTGPVSTAIRRHGALAQSVGVAILSGVYRPGDFLPRESSAREQLDVSRSVYREAVRILAAKGLIECKTKVGTTVNPRHRWHLLDPDVLRWAFEEAPDFNLLDSLFELLDVVETAAAGIAATQHKTEQLFMMLDAVDRVSRHTLATPEGQKADRDFHATVLIATQNPYLASLTSGVIAAMDAMAVYKQHDSASRADQVAHRFRVYMAIAKHDPERAQHTMRTLVCQTRRDIRLPQRSERRSGLQVGRRRRDG